MDRVEDCISFLIGKAAQQISRRAREKLAAWSITPSQYAILKVLWEQDGQSGAAIGARLVIDSATITGVIDRLAAGGWLERRYDDEDRRVHRLFLTPRGRGSRGAPRRRDGSAQRVGGRDEGSQTDALWKALRRLGESRQ